MAKAMRFHRYGGPEVLTLEDVEVGAPGPGQVRFRQTASGVNFTDIYSRSGLYPAALPCIPGREGVGVVEAVGEGVSGWAPGNRASYAAVTGSYAEERLIDADRLIPLPDGVDDLTAAAITLRGMTARLLLHQVHPVAAGDVILVHAAAGGVGLILTQWARLLGATVIGTVSTDAKAEIARAHGTLHVLVAPGETLRDRVAEITGGQMVKVVYDAVGRETFVSSLDCLARRGHFVSYGQASGPIPPVAIQEFGRRGSLTLTRPMLGDYIAEREERDGIASDLFGRVERREIAITIEHVYPLAEAGRAHADLEGRRTTGSVVLTIGAGD